MQPVSQILVDNKSTATGVVLEDGSEIRAKVVLSNATPQVTFLDLLPEVSVCVIMMIILMLCCLSVRVLYEQISGHK